ncbi:MAG TPA: enoyl-CoA hydratase-related protein [Steroidobacteraceae bacterium]|nr:enoyl-CoA hydratase-related protein [Steroidobacteraceae bacterium]
MAAVVREQLTEPCLVLETRPQPAVALLKLNRAEHRNALNDALVGSLHAALLRLASDVTCRVIVLAGEGALFCAGADLITMQRLAAGDIDESRRDAQALAALLLCLHQSPKPTVALVHGAALGGGVGLAAACDVVLASREARFRFPEVRLGLVPAVISPYVIAAMGARHARRYFLSAEWLSAQQAQRLGLVSEVVAAGELMSAGLALAADIAAGGPTALTTCKQLLDEVAARKPGEELATWTAEKLAHLRVGVEARTQLDRNAATSRKTPK